MFEDAGYSGANLVRPGLERVRDLAAEGHIQAVLVHAPDRLSRKYAYQVLLTEEFSRHGVETLFIKAPQAATPEDQLLVQFQGMIAEYERAQILERSRRGKRHRAKAGEVAVLSTAPYGYRYVKKTDAAPACFEIIAPEATVVRLIFEQYTVAGLSIGAIARLLNAQGVPTRHQAPRWERSTVWGLLRNPAYQGTACFLRQNADGAAPAGDPALAPCRSFKSGRDDRDRSAPRRVDRDPHPATGVRGHLRAGGTAARG